MKSLAALLLAMVPLAAQDAARVEITASAWRTAIEGSLQAGGLPVDLRSDLNLGDQWTFFGRAVFKPGRHHRLIVEGSPYRFDGTNTISRSISYNNRTFLVQDTLQSHAELTYVFGGYEYDLISRPRGHFGLQVGGAYLDATGTIASTRTAVFATRTETIGLPLAGGEFRVWPLRFFSIGGSVKGMAVGDYGHYVQGEINGGIGARSIALLFSYQILDADIHESSGAPNPAGIAPRISGPIMSVQFRK
jgi:hypothetical protein